MRHLLQGIGLCDSADWLSKSECTGQAVRSKSQEQACAHVHAPKLYTQRIYSFPQGPSNLFLRPFNRTDKPAQMIQNHAI